MAAVFDTASSAFVEGTATSVDFSNLNVGVGANPAILVLVRFDGTSAPTGVSFTWDSGVANQAMSLIGTLQVTNLGSNFTTFQLWGIVGPLTNTGSRTIHGAWTNSQTYRIGALSYTSADQTGGATTFYNFTTASGTSAAPSVTISSATGDAVVAILGETLGGRDLTAVNNTQLFIDILTVTGANRASGAASVAMSATLSASHTWSAIGVSVKQYVASTVWQGATTLSGAGILSGNSTVFSPAAAILAGASTLSAGTIARLQALATLPGAGTLSANTTQVQQIGAVFSGAGSLSAFPSLPPFVAATLPGTGTLSGSVSQTIPIAATFAGAGTLSSNIFVPGQIYQGVSYGQGAGTLSAFAGIQRTIAATLGGTSTFSAFAGKQMQIAAVLAGAGTVSALTKFNFTPVVIHSDPVPVDSNFYNPALTKEQNAAIPTMITSNLNDDHQIILKANTIVAALNDGPADGYQVTAPLKLIDNKITIDIVALKVLLGLPP